MMLNGKPRNMNLERQILTKSLFASINKHALLKGNLPARNKYFDFSIVWNENERIMRYFLTNAFGADVGRTIIYIRCLLGRKWNVAT